MRAATLGRLVCVECGLACSDTGAARWRAYLIGGIDGEPEEVAIYCADCADFEFGEEAEPT